MSRLGPKQTLTVYVLVLCWSVLVFWAGFAFGVRKPAPDPIGQASARFPARTTSRAHPTAPESNFQDPVQESESRPHETASALEVRSSVADAEAQAGTDRSEAVAQVHTVQIGAVRTEAEGHLLLGRLGERGHRGRIVPSSTDNFYRIWVGKFGTEAAAAQMEETLKSDGFSTFVRQAPDSFSR